MEGCTADGLRRAHIGRGTAITEDDGLDPVSSNLRLFKHCIRVGSSDKCWLNIGNGRTVIPWMHRHSEEFRQTDGTTGRSMFDI